MSDFTPSLDQLRSSYVARWYEQTVKQSKAEFDRAIAKVRTDAKQEALREAADLLDEESPFHNIIDTEAHWAIGSKWAARLRTRADNLEAS